MLIPNMLLLLTEDHRCHNIHKLGNNKLHVKIKARCISKIFRGYPIKIEDFECFWYNEMDTQMRAYPEKLRILSTFGVTRWIPKWERILKSWRFWALLVQRKRAKSIPISPQWWCGWRGKHWVCSDYKIRSHLCIVTRKVFKIFNSQENPPIWVCISLHQKHSKSSTSQDTLSVGYPSRYTKSTQNSHFSVVHACFRISIPSPRILWHHSFFRNFSWRP